MRKRCELCNVDIDENDFSNHLQGKKHLKNVENENYKQTCLEKSIYVGCLPPGKTVDDIIKFFSQFDVVERCKLERHFAIVVFKKKETVNFLLSRTTWMDRHKLDVKRRRLNNSLPIPKQAKQDSVKSASEIAFAELKTKLASQKTFDDELTVFLETIQLTEDEVGKNWHSINSSLFETLRFPFPKCKIDRFGSSITGLCFKGSDIDVYLNIGEKINENEDQNVDWTPKTIFKEVKFALFRTKNIFHHIVLIPRAKTPVIKFLHFPTSTNCDITFKNGLGVINSQMIKRLLSLDVRIKPLMIIIKFWAKTFELSGCGKFTNYAIVMIIVFYLQQPETKLLPTIEELQKNCQPIYEWNWQVNFDRNSNFPASTNENSVSELLAGFFKFYEKFPFNKKLISPLLGLAHSRDDFLKISIEQGKPADYLTLDRPVCLQDPIELDNNITWLVTPKILENFQKFCTIGAQICETARADKNKPFLLNLFTTLPVSTENKNSPFITISSGKTLEAGLPADFAARTDIENKKEFIENNWYKLTQKLVEDVLTRVFKMNVQMQRNGHAAKQQKITDPSDVHTNKDEKIVLECTGNYLVMEGRKLKGFYIDPSLSNIDKEALISDEVVKKQIENGVQPTKFDFTCTIFRERNPVRLVIRLKDRNSVKKRFKTIASFLNAKLPIIIDKELMRILQ